MTLARILVIDDDRGCLALMGRILGGQGYEVELVEGASAAEASFRSNPPDLAIVDQSLPDGSGLALLPLFKSIDLRVPLMILTGHASIDLAVDTIKAGAEQFLTKPVSPSALLLLVQRALEHYRIRRRQVAYNAQDLRSVRDPFVGVSDAIHRLREQAHRVLESDRPVLIQGETGSGKGVLTRWLHHHGPRAQESFVDINCASLSGELLESELFGHARGAFTGAVTAKMGLLEVADRGTAFLDEIGEMSLQVQPRLLKVMEEQRFRRIGDVVDRTVNVRLITATNRDLGQMTKRGEFRSDLYFRINTLRLVLPRLRDRPDDIPALALDVAAEVNAGRPVEFTPAAIRALQAYAWPGNVRELRNVVERALLLSAGSACLDVGDLPFDRADADVAVASVPDTSAEHGLTLDEMERVHIERAVRLEDGVIECAAARLGVSRSALYQKLKRYRDLDRAK